MADTAISPCPSWVGRILGHQFEPRYSVIGQELDTFFLTSLNGKFSGPPYQRTYNGDVCVRCGMVVNKR